MSASAAIDVSGILNAIPGMDSNARQIVRERAGRWLELGAKKALAAKQVLEALEAVERQEREQLQRHVAGLDTVSRIVEAFRRKPLADGERRAVQVLLDNPGSQSEVLTSKARWRAQHWHMKFGLMCRERQHLLWPAPFDEKRDDNFYCGILADLDDFDNTFTMKPEAVEAFRQLGVVATGQP